MLTREAVMAAAVDLADAEGPEGVTMRRLGARLGVEAMSLYHHVRSKQDLLEGLAETVLSSIDVPQARISGWRDRASVPARAVRDALAAHPGATRIVLSIPALAARARYPIESAVPALVAEGLSERDATQTIRAVQAYVLGFALSDTGENPQDAEIDFERGLNLLIDGIAARL